MVSCLPGRCQLEPSVTMFLVSNFLSIRAEHLRDFIKKYEQGRTKCKLIDVFRTRWISRIDGLDVFEEIFTYIVETLEYFSVKPAPTINRDTSSKVQALLTHISNFYFIVSLVITRNISDFTHSVTALLQAKSNSIINEFELIGSLIDLMLNIRVNIENTMMNGTQRPVNYPRKLMLMILCQELVLGKLQGKISLLNHDLIITKYHYQFH